MQQEIGLMSQKVDSDSWKYQVMCVEECSICCYCALELILHEIYQWSIDGGMAILQHSTMYSILDIHWCQLILQAKCCILIWNPYTSSCGYQIQLIQLFFFHSHD